MLQLIINKGVHGIDLDQGRITIGREGANTVVLDADDVSGYHAEIHCEPGGVYLVDLGSTNGTSVNGKRIGRRQKLETWDRVSFASVEAELVDTEGRRPTQVLGSMEQAEAPAGIGPVRLVGKRENFAIFGRHVIGRDAGCDFTVSSDSVSRRHARLELHEGRLMVTDLGSTNGTFVNGQRVQERVLKLGDEVRFDLESFRVEGPVDLARTSVSPSSPEKTIRSPRSVAAVGTTVAAKPAGLLEVVSGMEAKSFALTKPGYMIGRAPGSDIELTEDSISSRHARLEKTAGGWRLTDLQSTNGTFVNDRRIDSVELKSGDRVLFGDVRVRFTQDSPRQAHRPETMVMPGRSDTALAEAPPHQPPRPAAVPMPTPPDRAFPQVSAQAGAPVGHDDNADQNGHQGRENGPTLSGLGLRGCRPGGSGLAVRDCPAHGRSGGRVFAAGFG